MAIEPKADELPAETVEPLLTERMTPVVSEQVAETGVAPMPLAPQGRSSASSGGRGGAVVLRADARQEYLAGGPGHSALAYAKSLPEWIDDATRDFGADLYERMMLDPHVAGEVTSYKLAVLANGVGFLPAADDSRDDVEQQRKHRIAEEVRRFCEACFDEMDAELTPLLDDMLEAFALGHRLAEVVYRRDGSYLMLDHVQVKDRRSYAFVVNSRGRLLGVLGALAGHTQHVLRPGLVVDPAKTPNLLPAAKFARLTWRPRKGDPRGTSALRPAYNPWWQKRQTEVELAKFVVQFAGSGIVATLGENAKPMPRMNADGTIAVDTDGNPLVDHPADAMLTQLLAWKNGSALVAPFGTEIKNLVLDGAGAPFFAQLDRCDRQMTKAILGQVLATNEAEHDSRAASEGHKDLLDVLVGFGEESVAAMLTRLCRHLVLLNFGADYLPFVPKVTLSAAEEADVPELMGAFAGVGYTVDPAHLPEMDAKLGLTPREDAAVQAARVERSSASSDQRQKPDPAKPGPNDKEDPADA